MFSPTAEELISCLTFPTRGTVTSGWLFAAYAGLQGISSQYLSTHPYGGEINYRANLEALRELKGQAGYDAAIKYETNAPNKHSSCMPVKQSLASIN